MTQTNVVVTITATPALSQSLKSTTGAVEWEIVLAAVQQLHTTNISQLADTLRTGHARIEKTLDKERHNYGGPVLWMPDDPVICRITTIYMFTHSLTESVRMAEREVIRAACIACRCNERAVRRLLHAGHDRFKRQFLTIREELGLGG